MIGHNYRSSKKGAFENGASYEIGSVCLVSGSCVAHSRTHVQRTGWAVLATIDMGTVGITGQNCSRGSSYADLYLAFAPKLTRTQQDGVWVGAFQDGANAQARRVGKRSPSPIPILKHAH